MTTREFELLLICATSQPNEGCIKDIVQEGVSWQTLLELATQHGIRPILRQTLRSVCWDTVPQTIQNELDHFYTTNVQTSLLFTAELLNLRSVFHQNGIPFAAFKGVVLGTLLYGDPALREFSDLDILVHDEHVSKVEDILTARHYLPDFLDKHYRSTFLRYQGQYAFRNKQTGTSVDLHWRLSSKGEAFPLNESEIWPRLRHMMIHSRPIPTLANDDLVLFLAAHGTKEGWRSLKWVCDFAEVLRKCQDINWKHVVGRAKKSNCMRSLELAMVLASTLLGTPAPTELIAKASDNSAIHLLAEKAKLRMLRVVPEGELRQLLDGFNTHDKAQGLARLSHDSNCARLPSVLFDNTVLTRPLRLMVKAAEMIVRRST